MLSEGWLLVLVLVLVLALTPDSLSLPTLLL